MGIPRLTPWLRNTFPDAFRNEAQLKAEHVYIDLNSVLHETLSARGGSASEEVFLQAVLARVDHLLDRVTPSQTLFVAIDGPACAAKVPEQRRRRRARPPRARELGVTLNMLTPGVPVMDHLAAVLREHLKRLQAEGQLPGNLQVMVSGPDDAGEGEHKIMLQLVMNESLKSGEDEKHVIVGTDSDLLLVPLALLHGPRAVWVARCEEAVTTASGQLTTLRVCQTEQVVQSLLRQFINLATPTGSLTPKDELHLRLDFLLVTCLRGNDYLPQLASDHDSSELWPRYLRWRQRSQLGLVDLERADADEQICPVRSRRHGKGRLEAKPDIDKECKSGSGLLVAARRRLEPSEGHGLERQGRCSTIPRGAVVVLGHLCHRPVPRPPPLLEQLAAGAFCLRSVDRAADPPAGAELFQGSAEGHSATLSFGMCAGGASGHRCASLAATPRALLGAAAGNLGPSWRGGTFGSLRRLLTLELAGGQWPFEREESGEESESAGGASKGASRHRCCFIGRSERRSAALAKKCRATGAADGS
ncbi:unnamed protein product [Durusdinium trenchii]|uniref:Xrn1 N-terminal domain-containing protein n=1 Tax=Durusdinium trenchii TaxID=1381693 RepID=A0ABP0LDZ9_9DINO